ncbi:hypothetical protein [Streptomyces sp. CB01881]|uniref:hypothetical protein n=1 Tax=Streptomyces sp. CB01881 TaxID=2078691 RepID=UPI001F11E14F|nr:hypothetical protein [Streptomyces sp. CB01881]
MSAHRSGEGEHRVFTEVPTPAQIRRTSAVISLGTWVLTGAVVAVSMSTAAPFIDAHSPGFGTGPVMAMATDGCFILSLQSDSTLARYGVSGGRWPAAFRWVTGLATVWLNIGAAALAKDLVGVVVHLIPPLLLLLVAEAGPAYRRALARLARRTRPPLRNRPAPIPRAAREAVNTPLFTLPPTPFTPAPQSAPGIPSVPVPAAAAAVLAPPEGPVNTPPAGAVLTPARPVNTSSPEEPAAAPLDVTPDAFGGADAGPVYTDALTGLPAVNTSDTPVNTADHDASAGPFTGPPGAENEEEPEAVRLDETAAAAVIEQCWRDGISQREAARRSTRAPSYVSRVYKRLAEDHAADGEWVAA